jgi:hypothetical protein
MEAMAPTPADAPAMVEDMLDTFTVAQTIDGFTVDPRPNIQSFVLANWPRTPDGALDLAQAPLRLQAIVNRFDLRNLANGDAGEGRFVFNFTFFGFPLQANLILEYKLPAATDADVLAWAQAFHGLGGLACSTISARGSRPGSTTRRATTSRSIRATAATRRRRRGRSFFRSSRASRAARRACRGSCAGSP